METTEGLTMKESLENMDRQRYEIVIHIPMQYNKGLPVPKGDISFFEGYLLKQAGGYTKTPVHGAWVDAEGKVYNEPMVRYTVACDYLTAQKIKSNINDIKLLFKQKALYTVFHGMVQIS